VGPLTVRADTDFSRSAVKAIPLGGQRHSSSTDSSSPTAIVTPGPDVEEVEAVVERSAAAPLPLLAATSAAAVRVGLPPEFRADMGSCAGIDLS